MKGFKKIYSICMYLHDTPLPLWSSETGRNLPYQSSFLGIETKRGLCIQYSICLGVVQGTGLYIASLRVLMGPVAQFGSHWKHFIAAVLQADTRGNEKSENISLAEKNGGLQLYKDSI